MRQNYAATLTKRLQVTEELRNSLRFRNSIPLSIFGIFLVLCIILRHGNIGQLGKKVCRKAKGV